MNEHQVDLPARLSGLIGAVEACIAAAGRPLAPDVLAGLFGHAFESSYALGGAELWNAGVIEWSLHARGLGRLGLGLEGADLVSNNPAVRPIPSDGERAAALRQAWEQVRASVARGVPALAWSPMSAAQRDAGLGAFCWGILEGVDEGSGEYLVHHAQAGRFRVHHAALGRVDAVQWLSVTTFGAPTGADEARAAHEAIVDGAALLAGELPSADQPARAEVLRHGTAALDAWADEVAQGGTPHKARYWGRTRRAAEGFCGWAAQALPGAAVALDRAREAFGEQAALLERLDRGEGPASDLANQVAQLQWEALAQLRRASAQA
ncbi:MAG: hypothetical protein AB7N76_24005 [Planctomycetota bacterium]